ncbi:MAG: hypothetical protein LBH74_06635 [Nitrososphaerota archaeon]|jgi:hypothetical protein|uniref:hypothetical protein n=1 Tax=Candidatus Bathycorpusculum sp. TaxID=2994959 RepID=UPI00282E2644|nr:hypothetical protein [Candidatus Termitimicrobium sp.]MCL2431638.1 hypothetical protein [Candidatus Termitimicrobium sp.]MDR0493295.1 hypothetical protein [Nitrososphaerota archaeon]
METLAVVNLLLDVSGVINFIALLCMLIAVIRNRNYLRGFSIVGSFLTFVSIVGFEAAYYLLGNIVGFMFGWATVIFWFLAFVYSLKQKIRSKSQLLEN